MAPLTGSGISVVWTGMDRYGPVWTCRTPVGPTAGGRQPLEEDHVFLVLLAGEAVGRGHALALAGAGALVLQRPLGLGAGRLGLAVVVG